MLGARADGTVLSKPSLRENVFHLHLDWPPVDDGLWVERCPAEANRISLEPDISQLDHLFPAPGSVTSTEWQRLLEQQLFGLRSGIEGISGRAMLSLYMRRISGHAFNDAVRIHPQQSLAEASANVAYLLGLDYSLALRYRDLAARESVRRKLIAATRDPVWGRIVGRSSELRGQITVTDKRVQDLERQVSSFQIVPEYERLQQQADEVDRHIRELRMQDLADRRNLQDLEAATAESVEPDTGYLFDVYEDLGLTLGSSVRQQFEDVSDFHRAIVQNRRSYLEDEIRATRSRISARQAQRESLGEEQARLLQTLSDGGALDALTTLQELLSQERASLSALRYRYEAAQSLEASRAEIAAERNQLESEMRADIRERDRLVTECTLLFLKYAERLYGDGRAAYLEFDPTATQLKITPHIDSQESRGIGNMVIFCFDLTVAVIAHRSGRGPDFLVHDSHLFDGVDERQVTRALQLAQEISESERIQYIVTMNSDDLTKAIDQGFDAGNSVIPPQLTDWHEDGGLFGFSFQ
ncbi:ABC-three component system protein [Pseudonocardia spinosispora]|uniref:ABC-three component system protein n=1 Tax=Pseudonocardia spinosispora TaxID=103441 RepID=UPI00316AE741